MSDIEMIKKLAGIAVKQDLQEAFANTPAETSHPDPTEHGDIRDWSENVDTSLRRYLDSQLASPEFPEPVTEDEMVQRYKDFLNETVYNETAEKIEEAKCGCCGDSPCSCDSDCSCKTNESVEEAIEEEVEEVEESADEEVQENDDMFARIMQLAGVHKVTEDDINQPEAVDESEEVDEAAEAVEETEEVAEEEIVDEADEIEEQAIDEDVSDEESIEEAEQEVSESDAADLEWLKNIIKY